MFNLFRKIKSKNIKIKCSENWLEVNGVRLTFPINYKLLTNIFGEPSLTIRTKLTRSYINCWNSYGVYCNYASSNNILGFNLLLSKYHNLENFPKQFFTGEISISDEKLDHYKFTKIEFENYILQKVTYRGEQKPYAISIRLNLNAKKEIPTKKYLIKNLNEENINFKDFGFKLAIIQELMYTKELLYPKFNLNEFVQWFPKRKINLEKEGYEPIKEVTQFFKDLPIPKSLASEITEIYQDGGNEIYLNLLRFGNNSEKFWDIECSEDTKHFSNLKKVTLCYAKENVLNELNEAGIKTEWL